MENLDQAVLNLSKSLYRSAQSATVTKVLVRNEATITNPIYNIADEMLSRFQNNNCTGQELQVIRKEAIDNLLAETTYYVQHSAWSTLLTERDSKAMWGKINWNGCIANDLNIETLDLNDLSKQFQMKSNTTETSTLFSEINLNHHVPILDDEITVNEVKAAHPVLKEDKSSADGWVKAMVTNIPLCILYVFQII